MKPLEYIALLAMFVAVSSVAGVGAPVAPPNLVVILTEDQGYHDVGFNGCRDIPTPNLDSIARNGVRCTCGYVSSPLSSPSRAGLLTGRYQERFGYERDPEWPPNNPDTGLPLTETTLAESLGQAGYVSGIIGEWHLGNKATMHPLKRGFDEFFGFLGAGHVYLPEALTGPGNSVTNDDYEGWHRWILRNYEPVRTTNYLTEEFTDEAVRFIARHQGRPFLLVLAYNAPHGPLEAPKKYLDRFPQIPGIHRRTYAAMLSALDDGVGEVLGELRKDDLAERTLVVYLSASGGALDVNSSDNYPLRGSKDYPWEGGWRVPFALQWPRHLPAGMVYDQPVLSLDIFATITALAHAPLNPEVPLDGVNLVPFLTGQKTGAPHDAIYMRMPDRGAFAVRSGEYKLVVPGPGESAELFNVANDMAELENLAATNPGVMQQLEKKLTDWSRQMKSLESPKNSPLKPPQPIDIDAGRLKPGP